MESKIIKYYEVTLFFNPEQALVVYNHAGANHLNVKDGFIFGYETPSMLKTKGIRTDLVEVYTIEPIYREEESCQQE